MQGKTYGENRSERPSKTWNDELAEILKNKEKTCQETQRLTGIQKQ